MPTPTAQPIPRCPHPFLASRDRAAARPPAHTAAALAVWALLAGAMPQARAADAVAPPQQQQQARLVQHDIAAGTLDEVLNRYAAQAGVTLVVDARLTAGLRSAGLQGRWAWKDGLARILDGTGLQAQALPQGGWTVLRAAAAGAAAGLPAGVTTPATATATSAMPAPAAVAEVGLPALRVRGREERPGEPARVTAATLQRTQARDLEDVFAGQADVVVGGGHAVAQKVYLRGLEDTLLQVTVDGAAVAGQTFHHTGRIQVEPELLKRVSLQAGPGDATAGPGALGGALRFETKDPQDLLRPGERAGALVKLGHSGNGRGSRAHTSLFGRLNEDWSALLALTDQDENDYRDGAGRTVTGSGARQRLGMFKLVGEPWQGHRLSLGLQQQRDEGLRAQRPQWVISSFNAAYPLESSRRSSTLGWTWDPGHPSVHVEATAYDSRQDLQQDVVGRWGLFTGRVHSSGLDLRNTAQGGWGQLVYGIDHRLDRIRSGAGSSPDDHAERGRVSGAYAQATLRLQPAWTLDLGLRHDRWRLSTVDGAQRAADGYSPNATLRWQSPTGWALHAGHGRALRGPKVRDAFKQDVLAASAADLRPEQAAGSELGVLRRLGGWTLDGRLFRTTVDDVIADPLGRPVRYENVGRLRSQGWLLQANGGQGAWQYGAGLQHVRATLNGRRLNAYEHNGLGTSQGDTLSAQAQWRATPQLELGWQGRFVRAIDALETAVGTVRKPGYAVHDLQADWRPTAAPDWTVSLVLKNVFDHDHLDHGSNEDFQSIAGYEGVVGSREPGRALRLSVSARF
ncbi:MAG: hypothetical protein RLY78_2484 [Pseudomonadota bacterium]